MKIFITFLLVFFIGFQIFFHLRAEKKFKKEISEGKSIIGQNNIAFLYGIIEPWKTKYCWAGIVQIMVFLIIVIYFNS
jgi:hypothetical protein